jgi:hypothetical protein
VALFPKIPDIGELEKIFDDDFDRLLAKLDEVIAELKGLRADLGGGSTPPPPR